MSRLLCVLIAAVLTSACSDPPPADYPTAGIIPAAEAPLGSGDVFELRIYYGNHELKSTHRLNASGAISVQFIGSVAVAGKLVAAVEEDIRGRLSDGYLRDPVVSITLLEANSQRVTIYGQVQKAGTIPYAAGMTIVEAVAQAGGFAAMAKKNSVLVTRIVEGKKVNYTVPVDAIGEGERPNFAMMPGDVVFVPERIF